MFDIRLHFGIIKLAANETLGIKDTGKGVSATEKIRPRMNLRVVRIHGDLVLCGIADETLALRERDIGGSRPVALVIGDDLDTIVLPDTDTANRKKGPVGNM